MVRCSNGDAMLHFHQLEVFLRLPDHYPLLLRMQQVVLLLIRLTHLIG